MKAVRFAWRGVNMMEHNLEFYGKAYFCSYMGWITMNLEKKLTKTTLYFEVLREETRKASDWELSMS